MNYPDRISVIASVLKREKGGRGQQKRCEDCGSRGLSDAIASFEDGGRGSQTKKCKQPVEGGKGKGIDSLLEPPEGMQTC